MQVKLVIDYPAINRQAYGIPCDTDASLIPVVGTEQSGMIKQFNFLCIILTQILKWYIYHITILLYTK